MNNKIILIAEAGVNHNGSIKVAKKMIDVAAASGADFIKFQIFKTNNLIIPSAPKAKYQKVNTPSKVHENQFDMLKKYELTFDEHLKLIKHAKSKKINYLGSVFDLESLSFLRKHSNYIKIPSGEITNFNLLNNIKGKNINVILSTGASSLIEVKKALSILIKKKIKKKNITIMHCNSDYPTSDLKDLNLNVLTTFKKELKTNIGYSDHTLNNIAAIISISLGATMIEKHFTLNKNSCGPDHTSSLNPLELKKFSKIIKDTTTSLGGSIKKPSKSEVKNVNFIRKSIYAKEDIKINEKFTTKNIICKRPSFSGIKADKFYDVLGKKSPKQIKKNNLIKV